ncbi:hypothetical protein [Rhizobium anhuiense]|uniref:hypothetical protein n=1 Tax=Rhizobium anhuiense TaxID=1184720 RepID=UPI0015CF2E70|nr:hypothetical protein [Rhizobium anhuiense]
MTHLSAGAYRALIIDFLARGMSLSPQEKRMRMIRQVVIFGIVLAAFWASPSTA